MPVPSGDVPRCPREVDVEGLCTVANLEQAT